MRGFINKYLQTIMYTICGILLILGSYSFLININHYCSINTRVVVSDIDNDYYNFKMNVLEIENNLASFKGDKKSQLYLAINNSLNILKKDGVYQLLPGSKIGYSDLYELNTYYVENVINIGWAESLKGLLNNSNYNAMINYLVKNANYMNNELLNNSNFGYETKNNKIRNTLDEEYHFILNNYQAFSKMLLEISKKAGNVNA